MTEEAKALVARVKYIQENMHFLSFEETCRAYKDEKRKSCSRGTWYNIVKETEKPNPRFNKFRIEVIKHFERCIKKEKEECLNP